MPESPHNRRACAIAVVAALLMIHPSAPARANAATPVRLFPRSIIPPPFSLPPEADASGEGLAPDRISVAAGAAVASDYDGSDHYSLAPVAGATARLHGHLLVWHGNSLGVDLVPEYRQQKFKLILAPFVDLNPNRTGRAHDPIVALLPKRKLAVEGGAVVGFSKTGGLVSSRDQLTVQVAATHDLGGVHRSFVVSPSVSYMVPLSKAALISASASFDVVGSGYARSYFGIDSAGHTASGLPLYSPGGGVKSVSLGLDGVMSLHGNLAKGFAVGVLLNYERLLGDFARSPLVAMRGTPNQLSAALGLGYTF